MGHSIKSVSRLRQRMIKDMTLRKLGPSTQTGYIRAVINLTRYLGQSPDTAEAEDLLGCASDVPLPVHRSHTAGIRKNGDGSYDIYFGPKVPEGFENNWLETIPGKGWFVALRIYGPLEPWIEKSWRPGEIELVR